MTIHDPGLPARRLWRYAVAAFDAGAGLMAPQRSDPAADAKGTDSRLAALAARYGATPATALAASPGYEMVPLLDAQAMGGYLRRGRWALTPGDVAAEPRQSERALSAYLDVLRARGLRPVFAAVTDPKPYGRRGFFTAPSADEAVVDLRADPAADRTTTLRRSVNTAARAGLLVLPCRAHHAAQVAALAADAGSSRLGYGVAGRGRDAGRLVARLPRPVPAKLAAAVGGAAVGPAVPGRRLRARRRRPDRPVGPRGARAGAARGVG